MKWKCEALKVVVEDARLARYDTFFKEHTFLKLDLKSQHHKIGKRGARWNEFKGELKGEFNAILDIAPFLTLVDEATYRQQLTTYRQAFFDFKADGAQSTFSSFDGNGVEGYPQ